MRLIFASALALLVAGCAATAPVVPRPAPVVACTPDTVVDAGRYGTLLPASCNAADPVTRERYDIGRRIARVDEEMARVNYLIASRDGRRRSGTGDLVGRRVELKSIRRVLRRQAGIT